MKPSERHAADHISANSPTLRPLAIYLMWLALIFIPFGGFIALCTAGATP